MLDVVDNIDAEKAYNDWVVVSIELLNWYKLAVAISKDADVAFGAPSIPLKLAIALPVCAVAKCNSALLLSIALMFAGMIT
jgi:hypothetical protein